METVEGGRVATVDYTNNNKFIAIEDGPRKDAPNDVTEIEAACEIGHTYLVSQKLITNDIQHNLMKKQKNQTETKKLIHNHDTEFKKPDEKKCDQKNYICDHCRVIFNYKNKLRKHMPIHSSTSKLNHSCPTSFQLVEKHSRHYVNMRFTCNLCMYRFISNEILQKHKYIQKKRFKCDGCNFTSAKLDNWKAHISKHTGEKPFKCDMCDYASSELSNFKRHVRTHTGEKPFKCDRCNFVCSNSGNLKIHMRTHTGEKPFKCDMCNYASSQSSALKRHMTTHAVEQPH